MGVHSAQSAPPRFTAPGGPAQTSITDSYVTNGLNRRDLVFEVKEWMEGVGGPGLIAVRVSLAFHVNSKSQGTNASAFCQKHYWQKKRPWSLKLSCKLSPSLSLFIYI